MTLPLAAIGFVLLSAPLTAAHAIRAADMPPPAPEAVRAANPRGVDPRGADPRGADPAATVRSGEITGISAADGQVEIDGVWYRLSDGMTRIYRQGRAATVTVLARGQRVSFSVAGSDARSLGVIYVQ